MSEQQHTTSDCCGMQPHSLLSVDEAKKRIVDFITPIRQTEQVATREALNRILATDIQSTINVPPHDNSAMDGYALLSTDLPATGENTLAVVGSAFAGSPFEGTLQPGQCIRIMTGAVMPAGADTVIMQERVTREDDRITIGAGHKAGQDVRHIGEDMRIGQTVLRAGDYLYPADIGILASLGLTTVTVWRMPRVAFFSTGDELREPGEILGTGDIYDSNRYTLHGMLTRLGVEAIDMGVIRDERAAVKQAFLDAAAHADAIITSGGASVGEADYVKEVLDEIGEVNFWRVAMKPGKPLAAGRIKDKFFFGLPGNPVSAMATFYQFVQPALRHLRGEQDIASLTLQVRCSSKLKKSPGRLEYQRGILKKDSDGALIVDSTGLQGSHVLTSMSRANCFIILPAACAGVEPGDPVEVQPFAGLI